MPHMAAVKKEIALEEWLSIKSLYFKNIEAEYFTMAESKQTGINIKCSLNQPLLQEIEFVKGNESYKPKTTQIVIYKVTGNEAKESLGIISFNEPISIGDSICDGPENLDARLVAENEVFEGICDIIFKYKQQVEIKIEAKNLKDRIWDIAKYKNLLVKDFCIFTKREIEEDVPPKLEDHPDEKDHSQNTSHAQKTIEEIIKHNAVKYLRKII